MCPRGSGSLRIHQRRARFESFRITAAAIRRGLQRSNRHDDDGLMDRLMDGLIVRSLLSSFAVTLRFSDTNEPWCMRCGDDRGSGGLSKLCGNFFLAGLSNFLVLLPQNRRTTDQRVWLLGHASVNGCLGTPLSMAVWARPCQPPKSPPLQRSRSPGNVILPKTASRLCRIAFV
jgi:hypothetical protein